MAAVVLSLLRVDRLLTEVHHSDGDPVMLTGLFGLSDITAIRYCLELGPLDKASSDATRHPHNVVASSRLRSRVMG